MAQMREERGTGGSLQESIDLDGTQITGVGVCDRAEDGTARSRTTLRVKKELLRHEMTLHPIATGSDVSRTCRRRMLQAAKLLL